MDNVTDVSEVHGSKRQPYVGSSLKVKLLDTRNLNGEELSALWQRVSTQDYAFDDNTRGDAQAFVLNLVAPASLFYKVNDSALVILHNVYRDSNADIHFIMWDRNFSLRGLVEAGRQILELLFKEQGIHRVTGYVPKFNTLATRFTSMMGFKYEGTLRKTLKFHGEFVDVDIYGLLANEFERRFSQ